MCCGAIYWSGIPRVVYGCSAEELGAITYGSLVIPSHHILGLGRRYVEVIGPVLEPKPWPFTVVVGVNRPDVTVGLDLVLKGRSELMLREILSEVRQGYIVSKERR